MKSYIDILMEAITGYKQLKGWGQEPVGSSDNASPEEREAERKAAADRVAAKRAARAKQK